MEIGNTDVKSNIFFLFLPFLVISVLRFGDCRSESDYDFVVVIRNWKRPRKKNLNKLLNMETFLFGKETETIWK